jgi:hypothetical protein
MSAEEVLIRILPLIDIDAIEFLGFFLPCVIIHHLIRQLRLKISLLLIQLWPCPGLMG